LATGLLWQRLALATGPLRARQAGPGAWTANQRDEVRFQARLDAVLAKVHQGGMDQLTEEEKQLLAEATQREEVREKKLGRLDRL
jgi:hypothetical protein